MAVRFAVLVVLLAGCQFDSTGSAPPGNPGAFGDANPSDASSVSPDAAPPCVDGDDDGFFVAREAGADCGALDCDDTDQRVHPQQAGAFTVPSMAGSFDYDCDGEETPAADTSRGGDCRADVFGPCEGTGWLGAVPACGGIGTWHSCESGVFSCDETERVQATMPCR